MYVYKYEHITDIILFLNLVVLYRLSMEIVLVFQGVCYPRPWCFSRFRTIHFWSCKQSHDLRFVQYRFSPWVLDWSMSLRFPWENGWYWRWMGWYSRWYMQSHSKISTLQDDVTKIKENIMILVNFDVWFFCHGNCHFIFLIIL